MTIRSRLPFLNGVLVFEATWSGTADQKALTLGFSALFWSLWISLWLPVITTIVWLVAPVYGANQLMGNRDDSLPTLALILAIGLALGAFIGLWGTAQLAFGQVAPRREEHVSVTYEELSDVHDLADGALKDAWDHRRLVIHHDTSGHVTAIEASVPRSAETSARRANIKAQLTAEPLHPLALVLNTSRQSAEQQARSPAEPIASPAPIIIARKLE